MIGDGENTNYANNMYMDSDGTNLEHQGLLYSKF
jgi:hypothetical protein